DRATGAVVRDFFAYDQSFTGGVRVAVGDVTGDSTPDIVTATGAGGGPHVKVFDGATGKVVREFYAYDAGFSGGVFVAVADLDADGKAEIVTGPGAGIAPTVKVFSGADGSLLTSFAGFDAGFTGGVRVAAYSLDASGRPAIAVAPGAGGGAD